jgi:hypothetical protein
LIVQRAGRVEANPSDCFVWRAAFAIVHVFWSVGPLEMHWAFAVGWSPVRLAGRG